MNINNNNLINNFNILSKEIENGDWKGRENELSQRVNNLISSNNQFSSIKSKGDEKYAPLPIAVFNLIGSLQRLEHQKNEKIAHTMEQLSSILFGNERLLNPETLKYMSSESPIDLNKAVHTFKMLLSQKKHEIVKIFAEWIGYNGLEISKLRLSKDDLLLLAPHMKKLIFDSDEFSEEEVHEIITHCKNLKTLELSTNSIKKTPVFPDGITELTLKCNKNLESISSFNKELKKCVCASNENLKNLPTFLPNSVRDFICIDNATVRALPILNEGLDYLNCSNSQIDELPKLPKSLKELNIRSCERLKISENLKKNHSLKIID